MALLNSRGTLARGRWDFFERTNGVAFVTGSVASGQIGAYFANNSLGGTAIDIYAVEASSSVSGGWDTYILLPPIAGAAVAPAEVSVSCIKPDEATPAGVCGMFSSLTSPLRHITKVYSSYDSTLLNPIAAEPFYTLPPSWGIAVVTSGGASAISLAMTVWFQEVLDNIAPAR